MRSSATLLALVLAAAVACAAPAEPVAPPPDDALVVAVMGDGPYSEPGCDEHVCVARQVETLDPRVDLVIHVGDIRPGDTEVPCTREQFTTVASLLARAELPTIVVPGDNEWNDCPDPEAAAARWRAVFLDPASGLSLPWAVERQRERPENRSFDVRGVRFVAVNVVGGRVYDRAEWNGRLADDVAWLEARLAEADPAIRAAVVIGHATPSVFGVPRPKLAPFFRGLAGVATRFDRPLLYVHGDGHDFVHARDFAAPHAERLQVERIGRARPTIVTIVPDGDVPFRVEGGRRERCCD